MSSSSGSTSHTLTLERQTTTPADDGLPLTETSNEIIVAIDKNDDEKLKSLLDNTHGDPNINKIHIEGAGHVNLLTKAIEKNSEKVFRHLLTRQGIDVNAIAIFNNMGYRPLHIAAFKGEPIYTTLLLENGANVNAVNNEGNTPLHMAILALKKRPRFEVVQVLLDNGAIFNIRDYYGKTPVDLINEIDTSVLSEDLVEGITKIKERFLACAAGEVANTCAQSGGRSSRKSKTKSKRSHKKIRRRRRSKKQSSKK
jgi:hypothetical protein